MEVQRYLLGGKTLADLESEFAIHTKFHDQLPLVILNYDQIESNPKTHPIIRECRGLVLNTIDFSVVALSFPRFFNWGEVQDEQKLFNFSDFSTQTKEDGSLVLIYNFENNWCANTRGTFGMDNLQGSSYTWNEAFCKALNIRHLNELSSVLDNSLTYVCEFCSPYNKVVRRYPEPVMYLLTAFNTKTKTELSPVDVDALTTNTSFLRPKRFHFKNLEEIQEYIQNQSETDPTYEGVVICDSNFMRWKIKSATYLGLHRLKGEGDNIFNPKHLLPFVMTGEEDELLTYFNEVRPAFYELKSQVLEWYANLLEVWADHKDIDDQKSFALKVKDKPFSSILFDVRKKYGKEQTSKEIKASWKDASELILKRLKKN